MARRDKQKVSKVEPELVQLQNPKLRNVSANSIIPLQEMEIPCHQLQPENSPNAQEKVSFSNRVDEDLLEYKGVTDQSPSDQFYFSVTPEREEVKERFRRKSNFGIRRNTSGRRDAETTLGDFQSSRVNHSYVSERSVNMDACYKSDTSLIGPTNDSNQTNTRKMYGNVIIDKHLGTRKGRNGDKFIATAGRYQNVDSQ